MITTVHIIQLNVPLNNDDDHDHDDDGQMSFHKVAQGAQDGEEEKFTWLEIANHEDLCPHRNHQRVPYSLFPFSSFFVRLVYVKKFIQRNHQRVLSLSLLFFFFCCQICLSACISYTFSFFNCLHLNHYNFHCVTKDLHTSY